jgi:hypothetical protein
MKDSTMKRYLLLVAAYSAFSFGCSTASSEPNDPSIVFDKKAAPSPKVRNGTAYDRATVDLGTAREVAVSEGTLVKHEGEPGVVQIFMIKRLSYIGFPEESMTIRDARKKLGCMVKDENGVLLVSTYGEYDTLPDGGAFMRLVVVVPDGVVVMHRKELFKIDSIGREWNGEYLTKSPDAKRDSCYGPASPAKGWAAVPATPDPEKTAGKLRSPEWNDDGE